MKTFSPLGFFQNLVLALIAVCTMGLSPLGGPALAMGVEGFDTGVRLYREGQYIKAASVFEALHKQDPANINATYYLAMTQAQLGRFDQARQLYAEITLLDPQGQVGQYAKEGLKYLPTSQTGLDLPPRFQATDKPPTPAAPTLPQAMANPMAAMPNPAETGGMSPQDMQALQMMLGNGGGNNNNNMNMMMPFMMGGANGTQGMDPNIMSTMMMNQMLQNMDMSGGNKDNP